jgi:hypothetical protein
MCGLVQPLGWYRHGNYRDEFSTFDAFVTPSGTIDRWGTKSDSTAPMKKWINGKGCGER